MRTTKSKQNKMLDYVKTNSGLATREKAGEYLYNVIAKRFKELGYSLSHYKDNCFTITNDHCLYYAIKPSDLYTPFLTIERIKKGGKRC